MKIGFLEESEGNKSLTRLLAFECVNAGLVLAFIGMFQGKLDMSLIGLVGTLVGLGFTGKTVQKFAETSNTTTPPISTP